MIKHCVSIFFGGIIIYLWGEDIGNGLKEITLKTGEALLLLVTKIWLIPSEFTLENVISTSKKIEGIENPVFKNILSTLLAIVNFVLVCIFGLLLSLLVCVPGIFIGISKILEIFGKYIKVFMDINIVTYFLSIVVLAFILGRLFFFTIFPWFYKKIKLIFSLTIGEFFYYLNKGEREKLKQPIYLIFAILMLSFGSWLAIISPFFNILNNFSCFKSSAINQVRAFAIKLETFSFSKPYSAKLAFQKTGKFPLREFPTENSEILTYIPHDASLISQKKFIRTRQYGKWPKRYHTNEIWYMVTFKGETGWIYGREEKQKKKWLFG